MTSKQYHKFLTTISERYNPKTIYDIIVKNNVML